MPITDFEAAQEEKALNWITHVIHQKPTTDFEHFIQDGSILARVMKSIVFNSVPTEDIDCQWGANPSGQRVEELIREIKKYGVKHVFEPADLLERKNIPKVTKCLLALAKLADADEHNLLHCKQ